MDFILVARYSFQNQPEFGSGYTPRGQGRQPGGATPHPRPGAVAEQAQEGLEDYSTFKVRRGSSEEIPLFQDKEQQLRFTCAAMKRYPTSKVRETQVRQ